MAAGTSGAIPSTVKASPRRAARAVVLTWGMTGCASVLPSGAHLYGQCDEDFQAAVARTLGRATAETCMSQTLIARDPDDFLFGIAVHLDGDGDRVPITGNRTRASVAVLQGMNDAYAFHCADFPDVDAGPAIRRVWWAVEGSVSFATTVPWDPSSDTDAQGTPYRGTMSIHDLVLDTGAGRCAIPDASWPDGRYGETVQ